MMKLNPFKFALSVGIATAIFHILHVISAWLWPAWYLKVGYKTIFLAQPTAAQINISMGVALMSFIHIVGGFFVFAWAIATLYNYLIEEKTTEEQQ